MTATEIQTLPIFDLAAVMLAKYRAGVIGLARRAGLEAQDLPGEAILVTADALVGFDPKRGDFAGRWWTECRRHFHRLGGAAVEGGTIELAGGDDPLAILEADEALAGMAATGLVAAALRDARGGNRTQRRHVAQLAGAARTFGRGAQVELFGGAA